MDTFEGKTLTIRMVEGALEAELRHPPCNEIGLAALADLERLAALVSGPDLRAHALILYSSLDCGFSAGADLRELYAGMQGLSAGERLAGARAFLTRIHGAFNALDAAPLTTIAAVNGVVFGGGFELALTCDLIVADKTARFCLPELRLGLIPGFGGIPRLRRDLGDAPVRDLLLTGRSMNASRAHSVGLVSQLVGEGRALAVARSTATQIGKFDRNASAVAKRFAKPIPHEELRHEIEVFCELFSRPAVEASLRKFFESKEALPYLP